MTVQDVQRTPITAFALALTLLAGCFCSAAAANGNAPSDAQRIKVYNFTGLSGAQEYLNNNLPKAWRQRLLLGKEAVFMDANAFPNSVSGTYYCVGVVGLTSPVGSARHPRIPAHSYWNMQALEGVRWTAEKRSECEATAVRSALTDMTANSLKKALVNIGRTASKSGRRTHEPADPSRVWYLIDGITTEDGDSVVSEVPDQFTRHFDYRKLQWIIYANAGTLFHHLVCTSLAGVTAHAPQYRMPRFPGNRYWTLISRKLKSPPSPADAESCRTEAARDAVSDALKDRWDYTGLLANFKYTREDGVALVKPYRRHHLAKTKAQRPGHCSPPAGRVVHSRTSCHNGDCIRVFDNGCRVHFQAAYCYNPVSGQWGWNPDGC